MEDVKDGHIAGVKVERTVMGRKSEKNFKARIYSAVNPKEISFLSIFSEDPLKDFK